MNRLGAAVLLAGALLFAAPSGAAHYAPLETFAQLVLPDPASATRAADGTPGPAYWQNRADYHIHARLQTDRKLLTGTEVITYTNNSPQGLDYLWLQLDQNMYRGDARSNYATAMRQMMSQFAHIPATAATTGGDELETVAVEMAGHTFPADCVVSDTRLQIRLPVPLKSHASLRLHISWHYTVPGPFGGRTGWAPSKNGDIYDMAQWYPRLAVYDDLRGWDTLPYLANEFYLEYGDFDYTVTVPADMLVAGSGELLNPAQVLTAPQRLRLEQAHHSDRTVPIRGAAELGDPATRPRDGELTWHFRMHHTRDVAFAASRAFIWDAARINLPEHRTALAMSFYPIESAGHDAWDRSTEYFKDAVEHFSQRWYAYPWPTAINVAGPISGMEYPGMAFNGQTLTGKLLFALSAHEIGHTWFPMVVGFNERRDAWMDEGFNTFIDVYAAVDFNRGEYAPKHDSEYAPAGGNPVVILGAGMSSASTVSNDQSTYHLALSGAHSDSTNLEAVGGAMLGAGVIAAGVGLYLFLTPDSAPTGSQKAAQRAESERNPTLASLLLDFRPE